MIFVSCLHCKHLPLDPDIMSNKVTQFPQYRRYLNGRNYFCFFSLNQFEEIRGLGSKWIVETQDVKILPDRNLVQDLLFDYARIAEEISAESYASVRLMAI